MGIYAKKGRLYMRFKRVDGKWTAKSCGLSVGEEERAEHMLAQVERAIEARRKHADEPNAPLTVSAYARRWIERRRARGIADVENDRARLRDHIEPHIGAMEIARVRASHIVEMVDAWRAAGQMAPKTVHNCYSVCKALFRDAELADVIDRAPAKLTRYELGECVDADPEWRASAKYSREELERLISDPLIPPDRRVLYALEGLAATRHGEAAGLRWRHFDADKRPLGSLLIATSYAKGRTKTKTTRRMPVHPVLAAMLAEWCLSGWEAMMGRRPGPDDLIVPLPPMSAEMRRQRQNPRAGGMRSKNDSGKRLVKDLRALGLRHRRGHDLRRTMISLAQDDGAVKDILRWGTHGRPRRDSIDDYTSLEWETLCREVAKLRISRPGAWGRIITLPFR